MHFVPDYLKDCNLAGNDTVLKALDGFFSRIRVKLPVRITGAIAVFIMVIRPAGFQVEKNDFPEKIDRWYVHKISLFRNGLTGLNKLNDQHGSRESLRVSFLQCRLAYKQMALLTEYFNPFETFSLNSPALDRVEDDNPDRIIPPAGLQQLEQLIYGTEQPLPRNKIRSVITDILKTLRKLEQEPARNLKFRKELVWDALRSGTIRLITLGITGFDSPVANYSLPEAESSLAAMKELVLIFSGTEQKSALPALDLLPALADKSITYLKTHPGFARFDRLTFITAYLDPFYRQLQKARLQAGIPLPEGRSPLNRNVFSLFDTATFDINFYSPGPEYRKTAKRIALGKQLFSDPVLSGTHNRSCATCHDPGKAFADGLKTPLALDNKTPLSRNTPTLWNSGFQSRQFWDSRTDILENQLDEVVHNEAEMKGSLISLSQFVKQSPVYAPLFKEAYPDEPNPFTPFVVANSIANYIRSLVALDARFDRYMRGDKTQLTASEKNGFNLFAGKARCATCHFIPLFNGVIPPVYSETESEVIGVPQTTDKTHAVLDPDEGKFRFTSSPIHKYSFKTPTLRNIELTAPYMHNGVFKTLEQVVDFYNEGGGKGWKIAPPNQTLPFDRLRLTASEKKDLVAFMRSLTDTAYRVPGQRDR